MKSKRVIAGVAALAMFAGTALLSGCEASDDSGTDDATTETTDGEGGDDASSSE